MRFVKLRWILLAGATLGVLVPATFLMLAKHYHHLGTERELVLWPSAVMLMATENHGHDIYALGVLACSILLNVLYYSIIGTLIWCIGRVLAAAISFLRAR